jgi:hypothetical protein
MDESQQGIVPARSENVSDGRVQMPRYEHNSSCESRPMRRFSPDLLFASKSPHRVDRCGPQGRKVGGRESRDHNDCVSGHEEN